MAPPTDPATAPFAYDVFISYSAQDKVWVRSTLLPRLEAAGLRVCIDFRDFHLGAPGLTEMERGITTSRKTLLVLTPAYLASNWAEFENLLLQTSDPTNRALRLIPLLKGHLDLPLRIGMLTAVDFTDQAEEEYAWWRLLAGLGVSFGFYNSPKLETPGELRKDIWLSGHTHDMVAHFTGRRDEREILSNWLQDKLHPLLILRALGGFGKSTLAWYWLTNEVDPFAWPRVLFWSFYEEQSNFENFLESTLRCLGLNPNEFGSYDQVDAVLKHIAIPKFRMLLILDGFERQLRSFSGLGTPHRSDVGERADNTLDQSNAINRSTHNDRDCINHLADYFLRKITNTQPMYSKVLVITRYRPRAIERHGDLLHGCREVELRQLQPDDALAYFQTRGIRGLRSEIEDVCLLYGYHPLSLSLLAGMVLNDLQQPGDIASAPRFDINSDLKQRQHHVLEKAYNSLPLRCQRLLSQIACLRFSVEYAIFPIIGDDMTKNELDEALHSLRERDLLQQDKESKRYTLHAIVRQYAYRRLPLDARLSTHQLLAGYFERQPLANRPQRFTDLLPLIECYYHMARACLYDKACEFLYSRIARFTYYQFGEYQLYSELLRMLFANQESLMPILQSPVAQAWTLNELALSYCLTGQPTRAIPLLVQQNNLWRMIPHGRDTASGVNNLFIQPLSTDQIGTAEWQSLYHNYNLAVGINNLAIQQISVGQMREAERNLIRNIAFCVANGDTFNEAIGHAELGRLRTYCGEWAIAEEEFLNALSLFQSKRALQAQSYVWGCRVLHSLLLTRSTASIYYNHLMPASSGAGMAGLDLTHARHALTLADAARDNAGNLYPTSDYVHIHWLLGAAHRFNHERSLLELGIKVGYALQQQPGKLEASHWTVRYVNSMIALLGQLLRLPKHTVLVDSGQREKAINDYRRQQLYDAERNLEQALTRCRKINLVYYEADILLDLARLRRDQACALDGEEAKAHSQEASHLAEQALAISERCSYVLQEADVHLFLAQQAQSIGDLIVARQHAEAARDLAFCDGPPYSYKVAHEEAVALLTQLEMLAV